MELKKTLLIAVGILVVLLAGLLLYTRQAAEAAGRKAHREQLPGEHASFTVRKAADEAG